MTLTLFHIKMFDDGDLPVGLLTFGKPNCVLKTGVIKCTYVFYVLTFFSKSKKHDFVRFLICCTAHVFSNAATSRRKLRLYGWRYPHFNTV